MAIQIKNNTFIILTIPKKGMEKRVYFADKSDRAEFFKTVLVHSGFKSWKELRNNTNIPRTCLENYKNGNHNIPLERFQKLARFLPQNRISYFESKILYIDSNWGAKKGGQITWSKHKEIYQKAREAAWKKRVLVYGIEEFDLNAEICEFIGAFIGDGHNRQYKNHYKIEFAGDSRYDLNYYQYYLNPIIKNNFDGNAKITSKQNCLKVLIHSKTISMFLENQCKIPHGKKTYTVKIPEEIMNSNYEFKSAVLRGLYDTDGCIAFDKRKIYKRPYPRVIIQLVNKELIKQISILLEEMNLNPKIRKNGYVIHINGFKYVKSFIRAVGFSNSRHINRAWEVCPELVV